jgi:NADPH-dependent 2,4-dienoyl-CoA reductase/sulfur reductase-like enzyme/peroxiredoxin family protein/rhodanese-related sulfurtransferase/TusA-related sulfurtransferase
VKYLIVGGVAGGATAIARLRRLDEKAQIILFERGEHISYANCGLPYYIGEEIKERDNLFVDTPEQFGKKFNVDVRIRNEVLSIDPQTRSLEVKNLNTGEIYREEYDKLILSPGAEPVRPPIPGIELKGIYTLRNVEDTDAIKRFVDEQKPRRAIIVGAGFIGLEMAENLHRRGAFTTIIEMAEQVMTPLDYEMAAMVHQHLKTKNVEFYLKDGVKAFEKGTSGLIVSLSSGRKLEADIVLLSVGVRPEKSLAQAAGLEIGPAGGIAVNEYLQTSDPNIYAVGDAIEYENPIIKKKMTTYLAGPANRQARICADNIVNGNTRKYLGSINTAIAKVFDITVASTGVSEKILKKEGIPFLTSITHSSSHAGYYPGARPMSIKVIFSPEGGRLLGAQIVGYDGVDKRIDLLAATIKYNGTVYNMQEFEHAYAPPYSSAKDPFHIAGYVAENILSGRVRIVHWKEIRDVDFDTDVLLDVRTREEFAIGSIEGAINIPVAEIRERLNEIPRDKRIIVFCGVGLRGYIASRILTGNGFEKVFNLSGGIKTYELAIQKQSNEDIYAKQYIGKDGVIYARVAPNAPAVTAAAKVIAVDACGLQCPGPIMRLKKEMEKAQNGDIIRIQASDPGFMTDARSWANITGNILRSIESDKGIITAEIEKGTAAEQPKTATHTHADGKTLIVFSDDFDRALASFVIANGAAAMGKKVTMFFTFWGLNVIKKDKAPYVKKDFMGRMFGRMLPGSSRKLKLSKLNMLGFGSTLMRKRMADQKVDSLEMMIRSALDAGIELIACQMSMDVMGVRREELIDGVRVGGVATYLENAEQSNVNLFV